MPRYEANLIRSDPGSLDGVYRFVADSDLEALSRMPAVHGSTVLEIWRGRRLVAIMDSQNVAIANSNLATVAAAMIQQVAVSRRTARPDDVT